MITDPLPGQSEFISVLTGEFTQTSCRSVSRTTIAVKRIFDVLISGIALTLLSPFILLAMVAIVCNSPGSPFFVQTRIGQGGRRFAMCKLRTMVPGAHRDHQPLLQKKKIDPRVFPVGRILRRTSIDELPNLLNVLWGNMSIVGPRPMLDHELLFCIERHGKVAACQRLEVKPGITGLWQVSGRANLHFDERVELDITYAKTWTLWGDMKILLKTVPVLLLSRGAF